jgi:microcystin-dependent protein
MSEAFLGEIRLISFNFAPKGWALCNGQFLPINQNQALFSLLGTMYGGNGQTTFALPDLRGKTPLHTGPGFNLGQAGGEQTHTLTQSELPAHTHTAFGNNTGADKTEPTGNFWSNGGDNIYSTQPPDGTMKAGTIGTVGGNVPHENMSPFLVVNFAICLQGIFPSRN